MTWAAHFSSTLLSTHHTYSQSTHHTYSQVLTTFRRPLVARPGDKAVWTSSHMVPRAWVSWSHMAATTPVCWVGLAVPWWAESEAPSSVWRQPTNQWIATPPLQVQGSVPSTKGLSACGENSDFNWTINQSMSDKSTSQCVYRTG